MGLEQQYNELFAKYDEINKTMTDFDASRKKLAVENSDLARQFDESENQYNQLATQKLSIENQLEDFRKLYDAETKQKAMILGKLRNYENDFFILRDQLEEAHGDKSDVLKMLSKANAEALMWRSKYESDAVVRAEELENQRLKLQARLENAEKQIEALNIKAMHLEKIKMRAATELADLQVGAEKCAVLVAASEKKQRNYDKVLGEWKLKIDDLTAEIDATKKEAHDYAADHYRIKTVYDENMLQLDNIRRENKNLADEVRDLMDQIGDGGRKYHEAQKKYKNIGIEKEELTAALEEEHNTTKKMFARQLDSMKASLEVESKAKLEAFNVKQKLEADVAEMQSAYEASKKAHDEMKKMYDNTTANYADLEKKWKESHDLAFKYREDYSIIERKYNTLYAELQESRMLLEASDHGRRQAEGDLKDCRDQIGHLGKLNDEMGSSKKKVYAKTEQLAVDYDVAQGNCKASEDKAKKAMLDAAQLADELRTEQEHCALQTKMKQALEATLKELQVRYEEMEETASNTGKRALSTLENRARDLEHAVHDENAKVSDAEKNLRKCERRIHELTFQYEEDQKNLEIMQDLIDKLQLKLKQYKHQIEEAEEIAALNLAKFRKSQQELEETETSTSQVVHHIVYESTVA